MADQKSQNRDILDKLWKDANYIHDMSYERKHTSGDITDWERGQAQGKTDAMRLILATLRELTVFGGQGLSKLSKEQVVTSRQR